MSTSYDEAVWQQAREYHQLIHSGMCDVAQQQQIKTWLRADERHAECFRELEVLRRQTRYSSLGEEAFLKQKAEESTDKKLNGTLGAIAACVVCVVLFFTYQYTNEPAPLEFVTARGEIADFMLPDGSQITLGAKSHVLVNQNDRIRAVTQLAGDAIYKVTKDAQRPFVVSVDDVDVRVLGTVFEVLKRKTSVKVEVAEGHVNVSNHANYEDLTASEFVTVNDHGEFSEVGKQRSRTFANWRNQRFSFENTTIAEITEVLNRYRQDSIRLAHPEIGELVVTASFRLNQLNQFLDALQVSHDIKWHIDGTGVIWLQK